MTCLVKKRSDISTKNNTVQTVNHGGGKHFVMVFQSVGLGKVGGIMKKEQHVEILDRNIKHCRKTWAGITVNLPRRQ